jgi:hypothetical protein
MSAALRGIQSTTGVDFLILSSLIGPILILMKELSLKALGDHLSRT